MKKVWVWFIVCVMLVLMVSCRQDVIVWPTESESAGEAVQGPVTGFYLLNEGNMGSNKCTLDFYDYTSASYTRNIYGNANPDVVKELGDVGNDLQVYGSRLWAVINCSNKVEVMDAATARRIGQVEIPNCRYVAFDGPYAYITSYAGPVQIDDNYKQLGYVARVDTATLQVTGTCLVGYQPDGIAIMDGYAYVCNSGGYMVNNYERTVSVVNLSSMTEERRIPVAVNLQYVVADRFGQLWVSSRGDYYDVPAALYWIDRPGSVAAVNELRTPAGGHVAASAMTLCGDSLYIVGSEFNYVTQETTTTYGIVNVRTHSLVSTKFITDGTESRIRRPYSVAVNPENGQILVADARDYVNPGRLYCFSPEGVRLWDVRTGDIPAHFVFMRR